MAASSPYLSTLFQQAEGKKESKEGTTLVQCKRKQGLFSDDGSTLRNCDTRFLRGSSDPCRIFSRPWTVLIRRKYGRQSQWLQLHPIKGSDSVQNHSRILGPGFTLSWGVLNYARNVLEQLRKLRLNRKPQHHLVPFALLFVKVTHNWRKFPQSIYDRKKDYDGGLSWFAPLYDD